MTLLKPLGIGILLPAVVSGLLLLLAWRPWRRGDPGRSGLWGGALALGAGYIAGHVGLHGWPAFPPPDVTHWPVYFALVALVVGWCDAITDLGRAIRWVIWVLLSGGALWLLLRPFLEHHWTATEGAIWLAGLEVLFLLLFAASDRLTSRHRGASAPLSLLVTVAGGAVAIGLSGSASVGQLCGVLASALGAALVLSWLQPALSLARGSVPVVVVLFGSLLVEAHFYSELPPAAALLLWSAPLVALGGQGAQSGWAGTWKETLLQGAIAAVPVAVAIFLAFQTASADPYPY